MTDSSTDDAEPGFRKPRRVSGSRLQFRNATDADADFILSLRLDPNKNRHLSATSPDREAQVRWLRGYRDDDEQVYFIIEDGDGRPVGTVRLYDRRGPSFCWGSWILADNAPRSAAIESTVLVYSIATALGFTRAHFDVRKDNKKVWEYHERLGAERVGEDGEDFFYAMEEEAICELLRRYQDRVPAGARIEW